MSERVYTVSEIDALRKACETRWLFGTTYFGESSEVAGTRRFYGATSRQRSYKPEEKDKGVEELVRTYMLAGIVAADIYSEDKGARSARAATM